MVHGRNQERGTLNRMAQQLLVDAGSVDPNQSVTTLVFGKPEVTWVSCRARKPAPSSHDTDAVSPVMNVGLP